jgi:hypothetical protein
VSRPAYLTELRDTGSAAHSSVSAAILQELESLELVRVETHKSRRRVVVTDLDAFMDWLDARYPARLSDSDTLLPRAANITRTRSSKSGNTTHGTQPVLLKWFGSCDLEPGRLTAHYGLFATTSKRVGALPWPAIWHLLLVENWESFYTLDYPSVTTPIVAVYLGGQVADATLEELSSITPPPSTTLCFVDYDWSGLHIYARVRRYFPLGALYLPPDLETLFARYARHALVTVQPPFLDDDPAAQRVVRLIQQHNAGLEQEIVPAPSYTA